MCWMCQNPDRTEGDYLRYLDGLRRRHGWAVQYVERSRSTAAFAYTVGLTSFELPELVVTGLTAPRSANLLNGAAAHLMHADPPLPGELFELDDAPLLEVVELAEPAEHLRCAVELCGPRITALQMVWCDDRGRWPWDRGFRSGRGGQPVLGPRSPARGRHDSGRTSR